MNSIELAEEVMNTVRLNLAGLRKMISTITPESHDVELRVDEILGLALSAFNLKFITVADFQEITVDCLDRLTHLAR